MTALGHNRSWQASSRMSVAEGTADEKPEKADILRAKDKETRIFLVSGSK